MFASLRNHVNNLQYSQRFQYNNYEFYNQYENLQEAYKDDLSKVIFKCIRNSRAKVIVHNFNQQRYQRQKIMKGNQSIPYGTRRQIRFDSHVFQSSIAQFIQGLNQSSSNMRQRVLQKTTMEDMIRVYVEVLYENNYSEQRIREINYRKSQNEKQYAFINDAFEIIFTNSYLPFNQTSEYHLQILKRFRTFAKKKSKHILEAAQNAEDTDVIYKLSLQNFFQIVLDKAIKRYFLDPAMFNDSDQQEENRQNDHKVQSGRAQYHYQLYRIIQLVGSTLTKIHNAQFWNVLLFTPPNIPLLSKLIHPLTFGIKYFIQAKQEQKKKDSKLHDPKIVFLNLDGRQCHHNVRAIKQANQNLFYISIFKDPSELEIQRSKIPLQKMERFVQMQSQLIIKQAYCKQTARVTGNILTEMKIQKNVQEQNGQKSNESAKVHLYPMNSRYLESQYKTKMMYQTDSKMKSFPSIKTSEDILFLFEQILYEDIRFFNPTTIIISYNGFLNIQQKHFSEIVRTLTLISNHRIVLFPNFSDLFISPESYLSKQMGQQQQQQEQQTYEIHVADLISYYNNKMPFSIISSFSADDSFKEQHTVVNAERFFHNLAMFIKISSGQYNMQNRIMDCPLGKYLMGDRYLYLQRLASFTQFQHIRKKEIRKISSQHIKELYNNYGKWQLKQNKKDNESYQKLLDKVIKELLSKEGNSEWRENQKDLCYRMMYLRHELKKREQKQSQQLMSQYFRDAKQLMLLQNLETCKRKKHFTLEQDNNSGANILQCYRFYFKEEQSQQLELEKYTQVFCANSFNNYQSSVFIVVNYRTYDDRHVMLGGVKSNSQNIYKIEVKTVRDKYQQKILAKQFKEYKIDDSENSYVSNLTRNDIIYVNFSHFFSEYPKFFQLYLFWPQEWSLQDQAKHKLLGLDYRPKAVNKCFRVRIRGEKPDDDYQFEEIQYLSPEIQSPNIYPRIGCSTATIQGKIFIFGGIFDSAEDYFTIANGVNIIEIKEPNQNSMQRTFFTINSAKSTVLNKKNGKMIHSGTTLKPKMNYQLKDQVLGDRYNSIKGSVYLMGGYGRQTTNFYNLFSSEVFEYKSPIRQMKKTSQSKQLKVINQMKHPIPLDKPIEINRIGKFYVTTNQQNIREHEQKFSDAPKDKFIFTVDASSSQNQSIPKQQIITFLQENYRFHYFKKDPKKTYLFGFNRTVRQKIYVKFWSPELYVVDGLRPAVVHLAVKTEKNQNQNYTMANYMMPRDQDIISICLEQDSLYLVAASPCLNIDMNHCYYQANRFVLYQGSLSNMPEIVRKSEINMTIQFQLKKQSEQDLKAKTLFCIEENVFLIGGYAKRMEDRYVRYDYIFEKNKNKFKLKTKKLQCFLDDLNLPHPVIVKSGTDKYLAYSIVEEFSKPQMTDQKQLLTSKWKFKIQTFSQDAQFDEKLRTGEIQLYMQHPTKQIGQKPKRIEPNFNQPRMVKISPYQRFKVHKLKEINERIIIRINKKCDMDISFNQILVQLLNIREVNEQKLRVFSETVSLFYKGIMQKVQKQISQKQQQGLNYEDQDLIRDLKLCYSLINKMILEGIICTEQQPNFEQYRFIIEDNTGKKVKYMAIGALNRTNLKFFKIRFKSEFLLCFNQNSDEGFFYHPTISACDQIELKERFYTAGIDTQFEGALQCQQKEMKIHVSMKS